MHTNDVTAICEDNSGNIWIGTSAGLSVFDGKKFSRKYFEGIENEVIYSIIKDKAGVIWIASDKHGLYAFDGIKPRNFTMKNGLPTDSLFAVIQDKDENIWLGTRHYGVCKIDYQSFSTGQLKVTNYVEGIGGSKNVFCLMQDSKSTIWIGTTTNFAYKLENNKITPLTTQEEFSGIQVLKIFEDDEGTVWFATEEAGIIRYKDNNLHRFTESEGFPKEGIYSLEADCEKNLWIGTNGSGLLIFKNEAFVNFNKNDGLPHEQMLCIYEINPQHLLISTLLGLCYFDGNKVTRVQSIPALNENKVRCMYKDEKNQIWLGLDDGVAIVRESSNGFEQVKWMKELNGTETGYVSGITGFAGKIWISTFENGVFCIDEKGSIAEFNSDNQLLADDIFSLSQPEPDAIWISYFRGGATRFDGKKFEHFAAKSFLDGITVESIVGNKNGDLFFATTDKGLLCKSKNGKQKFITKNDGLSSNVIVALMKDEDNENMLWMSTSSGLNRLILDADFNVVSNKIYREDNGLLGSVLTENTLTMDANKNLWIGSVDGLTRFNIKREKVNLVPPKVQLSGIRLFYQLVDWSKLNMTVDAQTGIPTNLELDYKNNHLTFDFWAISIDKGMKYTFILEGFDKEWSPLGNAMEAIYSNIPPGKDYVFKVKAMNSDGIWSKEILEYKFTIESPIWQRWWFILSSVALLIIGVIFYINWRTAKLAKEKKFLEDTVAERTLELKETNVQLSDAFKDIKDSINYAQKIQQSILPVPTKVKAALPDSFILFKPRDIVSGDFYWFGSVQKNGEAFHIIAAADCTGHGVPGAFMSMVGNTILNEIVITKHITNPSEILSQLHHGVKTALQQSENESRDGMDICLCSINAITHEVHYAGAYNPLWILRKNGEMEIIKATKAAIGGFTPDDQLFESTAIQLEKGECIYLFTDGYADQFGGDQGKKLTSKKFRDALVNIQHKTMMDQGHYMNNFIESWKGNESQVDDILVIGIRI